MGQDGKAGLGRLIVFLVVLVAAGHGLPAESAPGPPVIEVAAFGVVSGSKLGADASSDPQVSPLFAATDAVGLPEKLALQLVEIFAEEVDFSRDLNQGYRCSLVFEMHYHDGLPSPGRILAAEFISPTKRLEAFLFDDGSGQPAYFDADGVDINKTLRLVDPAREPWAVRLTAREMTRAFRRFPLEFNRVTSVPARLRYHPILKLWRAHRGTDYAAPVGTRVRATADGEVVFMGRNGGYGKLVVLRHFDQYTTRYGHLQRFAPELTPGQVVQKGQVIGQVGMTGLTTGPHLHYELHADSGATAPSNLLLAVRTVHPTQRQALQSRLADYRRKLGFARSEILVRLD